MMEQHHQRQEGAGAIERGVARFALGAASAVTVAAASEMVVMRPPARVFVA